VILGIGAGAIIAALGIGLVLTYRSSGVINFAVGAVATYSAYVYSSLRTAGTYPIPPLPNPLAIAGGPSLPTSVRFGSSVAETPAIAMALATAALIGLLLHLLVFRPLRYAPVLGKIVAAIGVMIVLQSVVLLRFGAQARQVEAILPTTPVRAFGATVPADRFVLLGLVSVTTAVLWLVFKYTRFGIATRAAAENERSVTLLGFSADWQAGTNWVLACTLAGLVGILVVPITGLTPNLLTLLVIPALGAALLGGFSSFVIAAGAGVGFGMVESLLLIMQQRLAWMPKLDLVDALPFIVIALAMIMRGRALPSRGAVQTRNLPDAYASGMSFRAFIVLVLCVVAAAIFLPFDFRNGVTVSLIGAILCLSLVVVTGFVGQISLAQMALAGIAAFGIGSFVQNAGLPFALGFVLAVVAAVGFGLVVALPSLRTRGANLAIITLASAVAIQYLLFERTGWFGVSALGRKSVPPPEILGLYFGPSTRFPIGDSKIPQPGFGIFVVLVTAACCLVVTALRRSHLGERMLAVRANEHAAAAAGVNVRVIKLTAFGIAAGLAGAAGALRAVQLGTYSPGSFDVLASVSLLVVAYLGGISTVSGALVAGSLFTQGFWTVVTDRFTNFGTYQTYVLGLALLVTLVTVPEGLDAYHREVGRALKRRWRRPEPPAVVHEKP
jgi:branched-chain amino acid transport system permease protein